METALVFFVGQTLETAVADASRLIMTGQAQNGAFTAANFQQQVCNRIFGLMSCAGVMVDVQTAASFASATPSTPTLTFDAQGNVTNNWQYSPGNPGDIVVVRAMYQWPVYVSMFGLSSALGNQSNGNRLIMATAAFRNEPYTVGP